VFLTELALTDFRCYEHAEIAFARGATLFLGPNGHGKTNLIEAVEYVATLRSHRVASDRPLVRSGQTQAVVRARLQAGVDDHRTLAVDLEINLGGKNKARLNKGPVRPRDVAGALRVVSFAPEDLAIAKGDPADRRAFIDALVATRWPFYARIHADLDRALRQRTALLKALAGKGPRQLGGADETLAVWDDRVADLGAQIAASRMATLTELAPRYARHYAALAPSGAAATVAYASRAFPEWDRRTSFDGPAEIADLYRAEINRRKQEEVARGQSLVGPHRDDLALELDGLPVKGYASHGESWSVALALRLASLDLLRADGVEPVLLLDDVFAELDQTRRARLADTCAQTDQVLITAAVPDDVPPGLAGTKFLVEQGTVRPA
jgi:DNA replication and repair protein RecF